MNHPFRSIRWRLLLWHSLISLALVVAVAVLADRLVTRERIERIDRDLRDFERSFFRHMLISERAQEQGNPPGLNEIREGLKKLSDPPEVPAAFENLFVAKGPGVYLAFWDTNDTPLFISRNAPTSLQRPSVSKEVGFRKSERGGFREYQRHHPSGFKTLVGRDISVELAGLRRFRILLGMGGTTLLLAALSGGWWLAGRALRPLETISRTASRIAAGNLDERIAIGGSDSELDQLARVLNGTFERLAALIEHQKRFTADASHELRTPLTVILSETQRALKWDRDPAEYRTIIAHCRTAAKRMRNLVGSLLVLARQDLAHATTTPPVTDLAAVAAAVADLLQPIAEEFSTAIRRELAPALVSARPEMLEILVENILGNALTHPPKGTHVAIRTCVIEGLAQIEIHDAGPGIPAEHLPYLFDRFYRADPARSHGSEHSGLGLAIARSIAESLHGEIQVESSAGAGTTFRVRFPSADLH